MFSIAGRTVVITGGMGKLGLRMVGTVLERGARVAILDSVVDGKALAEPLETARRNGRLVAVRADVTQRASLEAAADTIERALGAPADGLLTCAALDSPPDAPASQNGPLEEYPADVWDKVMAVNVKGTFLSCQTFGARMRKTGRGSIINVSSIYGTVSPDQRIYAYRHARGEQFYKPVSYSTSKSALYNLTRYLATYWGPFGVRVNTVTFGGVFDNQDPKFLEAYSSHVPLGRMARPGEYDATIVFLLSEGSSYITGADIVVDGGWTAW